MKKVLYVTTVSSTINGFLVPHIKMLIRNGYEVDCACFINKAICKELCQERVKVFNISFNRNPLHKGNIKAFKDLLKIQEQYNYDIIHVHTPIASIYGRLLKLKFKNLKTIYTAHGYHFLKGGAKFGWLIYYPIEKIMAKLTDVTININSEDYEITKKRLKPKNCYLVDGVGIDLKRYKPVSEKSKKEKRRELGLEYDDFIIIMIAELNKNKNQMQLIKAIEILKNKYPKIKALFVGEGKNSEELKLEVNKRGLKNNAIFLGYRTDINELINISDIGALLSFREGLPRNIMELMANGKKIIATNIRGNRDLICGDEIGALVEVGDYQNTAQIITNYYLSKKNKENDNIKNSVLKYDIENINEEILKIHEITYMK